MDGRRAGFPSFYACYLLRSHKTPASVATYIGSTPHPARRIRQHNGELTQGARKTRNGRPWLMQLIVYGFPSSLAALQFEWAWQHPHLTRHLRTLRLNRDVFRRSPTSLKSNALSVVRLFRLSSSRNRSVARLMVSSHPYTLWPLHVKLFTPEAVKAWGDAARSTPLLPQGLTVQIELEGVDGKSGLPGSGRVGPLVVTDEVFTTAHLAKHAKLKGVTRPCAVCRDPIALRSADPLSTALCPAAACTSTAHLACLARAFLAAPAPAEPAPRLLPRGGSCPGCSTFVLWGDVVKGCYRRYADRSGDALDDAPPKQRARKAVAARGGDRETFDLADISSASELEGRKTPVNKKRASAGVKAPRRSRSLPTVEHEIFDLDAASDSESVSPPRGRRCPARAVLSTTHILPATPVIPPRPRGRPRYDPAAVPKYPNMHQTVAAHLSGRETFDLTGVSSGTESDRRQSPTKSMRADARAKAPRHSYSLPSVERETFDLDAISDSEFDAPPRRSPARSAVPTTRTQPALPSIPPRQPCKDPFAVAKPPAARGRPRKEPTDLATKATRLRGRPAATPSKAPTRPRKSTSLPPAVVRAASPRRIAVHAPTPSLAPPRPHKRVPREYVDVDTSSSSSGTAARPTRPTILDSDSDAPAATPQKRPAARSQSPDAALARRMAALSVNCARRTPAKCSRIGVEIIDLT